MNKRETYRFLDDYKDKAIEYANDVLSGKIIAGKYVKKECERFLWRMENQNTDEFPYIFDNQFIDGEDNNPIIYRINNILSKLNFPTGFNSGKPILQNLFGFQFFILHNIFGWVHRDTGFRLIQKVYLEIARKNGKKLPSYIEIYNRNRSKSVKV